MLLKKYSLKIFFLLIPVFWFLGTTVILVFVLFYFIYHKSNAIKEPLLAGATPLSYSLFFSNPPVLGASAQSLQSQDGRAAILEQYFFSQKAPLASYSKDMVQAADKYGLDWTLLPAIAMQESNGGKIAPNNSYNAWGWAVYGSTAKKFTSWEDGIEKVARGLKKDYIDKGLITPEQIMSKYCPQSLKKGGAWAKGLNYFMGLFKGTF